MKKTLLMATLLLAALTFSSDLCAQSQGRTQRSRVATTTTASSSKKVLVRSTTSTQISASSAKPMERVRARQGKTKGRSATTAPQSSLQKRKVKTVKRK